jgi:RNA polymerase sigma-70 factor (ECF subfamily)
MKRISSDGQVLIMDRRRTSDVRRIRTDPEALDAFYREHVDAVQRFVARRVSSPELAADLTADIFVAAMESVDRYRADRGTASAWLYGIARHVVWAEYRRADRQRSAPVIAGSALLDGEDVADILARIDAAASARELYRAMDALPESERAVLELVAVDELPVGEAADALGIGKVAARVRLHRARRRMKEQLGGADARQPVEAAP